MSKKLEQNFSKPRGVFLNPGVETFVYILLQVKACFRIRFTNLGEDFANSTQLSSSKIVVIPMTEPRLLSKSVVIDL